MRQKFRIKCKAREENKHLIPTEDFNFDPLNGFSVNQILIALVDFLDLFFKSVIL